MRIRLCTFGAASALLLNAISTTVIAQTTSDEQWPSVSANGSVAIAVEAAGDEALLYGPSMPDVGGDAAAVGSNAAETEDVSFIEDAETVPADAAEAVEAALPVEIGPYEAAAVPANEKLGLGVPNGIFSARPVPEEVAPGVEAGSSAEKSLVQSFVAAVDPRSNSVARVIASLGLVIGLILLFKVVMKRGAGLLGQGGRPSGVIEILARYPLGRKQSLVLIKIARRVLLVHQNGAQMATLSEVAEPMEVAALLGRIESGSTGRQAQRFRSMLKGFQNEHDAMRRTESNDPFALPAENASHGELIDLTRKRPRAAGLSQRRVSA